MFKGLNISLKPYKRCEILKSERNKRFMLPQSSQPHLSTKDIEAEEEQIMSS